MIFEAEYKGWKAEKKDAILPDGKKRRMFAKQTSGSLDAKSEKEVSAILFEISKTCVEKSFALCEPNIDLKRIESIATASSASRKDLLAACKSKEFYHLAESYYLYCICRKK